MRLTGSGAAVTSADTSTARARRRSPQPALAHAHVIPACLYVEEITCITVGEKVFGVACKRNYNLATPHF